jgi:hypothetical protein
VKFCPKKQKQSEEEDKEKEEEEEEKEERGWSKVISLDECWF